MRFLAAIVLLWGSLVGLGLSLPRAAPASHPGHGPPLPAPVAPLPRESAADGLPNPEYRLPPGELSPGEVIVTSSAGDVADWGHATIDVPTAWKATKGKGATVAVLDTGADHNHRDLRDRLKGSKDFTGSRSGDSDVQGHGTHCLGVVGASENDTGMVGVAPEAVLLSGKVLGDTGSGLSTWIAAGIDWAVEQGADVISMSLGSAGADPRIQAACQRAIERGVIVIAAAGNEGPREGSVGFPGGFPGVICVGAVDRLLAVAPFSSRGRPLVVAAPGVNVRSCYPGDRFATMSGTSMATPYVAGVAALYVSRCKQLGRKPTPAEFAALVERTSRDLPPQGRDTATGFGLIQPAGLLAALAPKEPTPEPKPKDPDPKPPLPSPGDRLEIAVPGLTIDGRRVKRIVFELEPK